MRLSTWIITLPSALIAVVVAVANRDLVTLRLDPFSSVNPAISFDAPLFAIIFAGVLVGMLFGGGAMWLAQGHHRRRAWAEYRRARDLEREIKRRDTELAAATVEPTPQIVAESGAKGDEPARPPAAAETPATP